MMLYKFRNFIYLKQVAQFFWLPSSLVRALPKIIANKNKYDLVH